MLIKVPPGNLGEIVLVKTTSAFALVTVTSVPFNDPSIASTSTVELSENTEPVNPPTTYPVTLPTTSPTTAPVCEPAVSPVRLPTIPLEATTVVVLTGPTICPLIASTKSVESSP